MTLISPVVAAVVTTEAVYPVIPVHTTLSPAAMAEPALIY
jgi:hypothetical protein